jgi:hypothetical protein
MEAEGGAFKLKLRVAERKARKMSVATGSVSHAQSNSFLSSPRLPICSCEFEWVLCGLHSLRSNRHELPH